MPESPQFRCLGRRPFGDRLTIEAFALENGLELLVLPDRSSAVVSYQTWFRVGSRDESRGKTGQAHLLEHLMFGATESIPDGEFDRRIERAGGESNAATWVDWTYYYENLPSTELSLAVRLESERMHRLVLDAERIAKEKAVVLSERRDRAEDDVDGAVSEILLAAVFGRTHPYGWPTIGWARDIRSFTAQDCVSFYRRHYAPDRATLVVAGDVEPRRIARAVARAYGRIPASGTSRAKVPPPRRLLGRERTLSMPTPTEKLAIGCLAPRFAAPDHAVATVIAQLLTGGRSSRLVRDLVLDREFATEARAGIAPFECASAFDIWVSAREGVSIDRSRKLVEQALERLCEEPVSSDELETVKNRLELGFLSSLETVAGKAEQIGFSAVLTGDPTHAFQRLEEYRRTQPEDVLRVARTMFRAPRVTISVLPAARARAAA